MNRVIEKSLSDFMDIDQKTLRFYALRMVAELNLGKQLSPEAQRRLYDGASKQKAEEVFGESS